ncbi:hypothetical protein A3K42_00570 [candidate division WWE3 bacterium RBG_13_37_7]|uniref:Adenylate kinase n=1 Tax=candidate division WWE3 bacterium RBG_13_37_7 TaxID=1802609 RepID=A0A1F4U0B5_UNCKA|nr:MAG: hypothetical protein A3K42_00570 [candidate division WWE3 bacterium RBG_13_37_7]
MKIALMGPQGCGKGTIGEMLSEKLNIPLVSMGQILRDVPKTHPRYTELQKIMAEGDLVPQELASQFLRERVNQPDCANGYILDGWMRKMIDLHYFDPQPDKVVLLNISRQTSLERLTNRRTCLQCGAVFNVKTVPPKQEGICDICGGKLEQREDDKPEAINNRLDIYYSDTQEVLNHFRDLGKLVEVDAEPEPKVVFESVLSALNL